MEKREIIATIKSATSDDIAIARATHSVASTTFYNTGLFRLPYLGENIFILPNGTVKLLEIDATPVNQKIAFEALGVKGVLTLHRRSGIFSYTFDHADSFRTLARLEDLLYDVTCIMAALWMPKKKSSHQGSRGRWHKNPDNGANINTVHTYGQENRTAASDNISDTDGFGLEEIKSRNYVTPSWIRKGYTRYDGVVVSPCINNRAQDLLNS